MLALDVLDKNRSGFYVYYSRSKDPLDDTIRLIKHFPNNETVYVTLNKSTHGLNERLKAKLAKQVKYYISPMSLASDEKEYDVLPVQDVHSLSEILFGIIELSKISPGTITLIIDSFDSFVSLNDYSIVNAFFQRLNEIVRELSFIDFVIVVNDKQYEYQRRDLLSLCDGEVSARGN